MSSPEVICTTLVFVPVGSLLVAVEAVGGLGVGSDLDPRVITGQLRGEYLSLPLILSLSFSLALFLSPSPSLSLARSLLHCLSLSHTPADFRSIHFRYFTACAMWVRVCCHVLLGSEEASTWMSSPFPVL